MNERQMRETLEYFQSLPGEEHGFVVQRDIQAQDRDGLGKGMSPEAMEFLNFQIMSFIGTRMMRFADERGVMPQNVEVVVSVKMEV